MEDVLVVYTRPRDPDRALVCLDETSKQLTRETRTPVPMKSGQPARVDYAALTNGPVATAFRYVTPHGPTHDDSSTLDQQGPTQPVDHSPEPSPSRARQRNRA